jgi:hypothetical protein
MTFLVYILCTFRGKYPHHVNPLSIGLPTQDLLKITGNYEPIFSIRILDITLCVTLYPGLLLHLHDILLIHLSTLPTHTYFNSLMAKCVTSPF